MADERMEALRAETQRWVDGLLGRSQRRRFGWFDAGLAGFLAGALTALGTVAAVWYHNNSREL